jgi:hypothetical protein
MMEQDDDLPPKKLDGPPEETESGARSFGELFGGSMFLFVFIAVAGVILYLLLRATH